MKIPPIGSACALALILALFPLSFHGAQAPQKTPAQDINKNIYEDASSTFHDDGKKLIHITDPGAFKQSLRTDAKTIIFDKGNVKSFQMLLNSEVTRATFFGRYADDLKLTPSDRIKEFKVQSEFLGTGMTISRHTQYYKDIEVRGTGCVLTEESNAVTSGDCQLITGLNLDVSSPLPKAAAISAATQAIAAEHTVSADKASVAELMIVPKGIPGNAKNYRLVWSVIVYAVDPLEVFEVDVIAKPLATDQAGSILAKRSIMRSTDYVGHVKATGTHDYAFAGTNDVAFYIKDAGTDGKYRLSSGSLCPVGIPPSQASCLIPLETAMNAYDAKNLPVPSYQELAASPAFASTSLNWTDPNQKEGVSAFWSLQATVIFFAKTFFVEGDFFNNLELYLTPIVPTASIFFNTNEDPETQKLKQKDTIILLRSTPDTEKFCGPTTSIDSVAHEFTHAIFQHINKGMSLEGEAGAIEEGFADVFALLARFSVDSENVAGDWLFREKECSKSLGYSMCFARSLSDPKGKPGCPMHNPSTYDEQYYNDAALCPGMDPECLAHLNSTIVSHWFYLLANGGSGTNDNGEPFTVKGIGLEHASRFLYFLLWDLHSSDNFASLRARTSVNAVKLSTVWNLPLTGLDSLLAATEDAWHAVGVGDAYDQRVYEPANGDTHVEPWPEVTLKWDVLPGEAEWYVEVFDADDPYHAIQGARVSTSQCDLEKCTASAPFYLKTNHTYSWHVIGRKNDLKATATVDTTAKLGDIQNLNPSQKSRAQTPQGASTLKATSAAVNSTAIQKPSLISRIASAIASIFSRKPDVEGPKQTPMINEKGSPAQQAQTEIQQGVDENPSMVISPTTPPDIKPGLNGWGNWGRMLQFTTTNNSPELITQGYVNPWKVELEFRGVKGATSYVARIAEDNTFATGAQEIVVKPDDPNAIAGDHLKAVFKPVKNNKHYFWRVTSMFNKLDPQGADLPAVGGTAAGAIDTKVPKPVLEAPANGSEEFPLGIDLKWSTVPGARGYKVTVSPNPAFWGKEQITLMQLGENLNTASLNLLDKVQNATGNMTFYWKVKPLGPPPENDDTSADESSVQSFQVKALSKPQLVSPKMHEAVPYGQPVTFTWKRVGAADGYRITISGISSATTTFETGANGNVASADPSLVSYQAQGLSVDCEGYSWQVVAKFKGSESQQSDTWVYISGPSSLTAWSPRDEQLNMWPNGSVIFSWDGCAPYGVFIRLFVLSQNGTWHQAGWGKDYAHHIPIPQYKAELDTNQWQWQVSALDANGNPITPIEAAIGSPNLPSYAAYYSINWMEAPENQAGQFSGGNEKENPTPPACPQPAATSILSPMQLQAYSMSNAPQVKVEWLRSEGASDYEMIVGTIPDSCSVQNPWTCLQIVQPTQAVPQSSAGNPFRFTPDLQPDRIYGVRITPRNTCGSQDSSKWKYAEPTGVIFYTTP